MPDTTFATLVELLRWRAIHQPDQPAYTFLLNGETEGPTWTYSELDWQARAIGALLQRYQASGERVLLLYPPGLEFIAAFFGCLYARAIAVPAYPPRNRRHLPRVQAIVDDARASVLLTVEKTMSKIQSWLDQRSSLASIQLLVTDNLTPGLAEKWQEPFIKGEGLAFLQYTSGSTSAPKGVMVSHRNLLHNLFLIQTHFETSPASQGVVWLPPYHDMGLIGGVMGPLFGGFPVRLMAPTAFLQKPARWLHAISTGRATDSGGPNFAYELCLSKVTDEQCQGLDLSSWRLAFNGSEPIHEETMQRFTERFAPYGFRYAAFYPCYGLAEATLFVTGGQKAEPPIIRTILTADLEQNRAALAAADGEKTQTLVGCGHALEQQRVLIVNPATLQPCASDAIGEIWVAGPSVAQGYWQQPDLSRTIFQATLADAKDGPFLRTGDLGFLDGGELFITGRLKDLMIIRGRNYYPQDIEWTIEHCHPAIRDNSSAAFAVNIAGEERIVIVAEVERRYHAARTGEHVWQREAEVPPSSEEHVQDDLQPGFSQDTSSPTDVDECLTRIREVVTEQYELPVYAILLLKATTIPRTSSGKIQRHACKIGFLEETLDVVGEWAEATALIAQHVKEGPAQEPPPAIGPSLPEPPQRPLTPGKSTQSAETIQEWLVNRLAERLGLRPHEIDIREPFARYGLDSVQAVNLSSELGDWLGCPLSPTLVYEYPNIAVLSHYLAVSTQFSDVAAQLRTLQKTNEESIAVIGLSCRFPGANSPEEFWQLLRDGGDAIREVPKERWNLEALYDPVPATPGKMNTRWGGFLDQVDRFDPQFFGLAPREAEQMDPQQRLLLEVAWEALESAGQVPDVLAGSYTGVFVGVSNYDYSRFQQSSVRLNAYTATGNALSIAANRLSYFLNLRGPSLAIDTACSSSLVAVHQACLSLRHKECDMALAGGVNLILKPDMTIALSQGRFMASDGRCKTFDARADGYVRGEGCGIIVLKRLSDALRDGDNVLALIRGSAVNQDGRSNGLTAPNGFAQQAVIYQALENAGVAPAQISYFETHGTGTALGDPIEVNALKEVLMSGRSQEHPCWIGSVKTNIGHLEAAAGIAGMIKVILALQYQEIPPHLHLQQLNPNISFDDTPISIPITRQEWNVGKDRRVAGVSSFGFGGTNAHVVLEETLARSQAAQSIERPVHLLTLSARTEEALAELAQRYQHYLKTHPQVSLADICFTSNVGRSHFEQRVAVVAESHEQFAARLGQAFAGTPADGVARGHVVGRTYPKIAFLFTGQGSQYINMGRQLYETQPTFRQTLDRCNDLLRPYLEIPLLDVLYPKRETGNSEFETPPEDAPISNFRFPGASINQTAYTQPALFAIEYALAKLWTSWGVRPAAVFGHSVGEYAAACLAGVFSLEDGLTLIAERARLMQSLPPDGKMVVVFADESTVTEILSPYRDAVSLAAVNGPQSTVISGKQDAIDAVLERLHVQHIRTKPLNVSHAFHSPLMESILEDFAHIASTVTYTQPWITLISDVTGLIATQEVTTPDYWARHIRQPVQFMAGIQTLIEQGYEIVIEIGPNPTLLGMGKQIQTSISNRQASIQWLASLRQNQSDWQIMLQSLGELYVHGVPVKWDAFERDYPRRRVMLPTYPFQRQRYWLAESSAPIQQAETSQPNHTMLTRLLNQGDVPGLVQMMEQTDAFLDVERQALPGILQLMVNQQQYQLLSETCRDWFYQIAWQPAPRRGTKEIAAMLPQPQRQWMILADQQGFGEQFARRLQAAGQRCAIVYAGETYQQMTPEQWRINPTHPEDWVQLLADVQNVEKTFIYGIIHLWSLDAESSETLTLTSLNQAEELGCGSLFALLQTVLRTQTVERPKFWGVTAGACRVQDADLTLRIAQAPLWGFGRTVALEHLELWGGMVDVSPQHSPEDCDRLVLDVLDSEGEMQVAYRAGQRYAARLTRHALPVTPPPPLTIHAQATYLITGGLGALGLYVARMLVTQGARQIVLTGRQGVTDGAQQTAIAAMKQAGANVVVAQADVADQTALETVMTHIQKLMPPLKGIIHAAGILADGLIAHQTPERFRQVLPPKIQGAWNLHLLSQPLALDFFVCFSSMASMLGSPGQSNYAAANAFLDALAQYRRSQGLPGISINWGPWADIGMAAQLSEEGRTRLHAQGIEPIPVESGLRALAYLLRQPAPQVGVFRMNWEHLEQQPFPPGQRLFLTAFLKAEDTALTSESSTTTAILRQQLQNLPVNQRPERLHAYLQVEIAHILGLGASRLPNLQQGFMDMGLDSLMTVEFKARLERDLGVSLPATVIFEYSTINDLAEHIGRDLLRWEMSVAEPVAEEAERDNIDDLSEEDFADLLAQELAITKKRGKR